VTKVNKENQAKRVHLDLKDEWVSLVDLDALAQRVTQVSPDFQDQQVEMVYQVREDYLVHQDQWDLQVKTGTKVNRVNPGKRALRESKETVVHPGQLVLLVLEESQDQWVRQERKDHLER